MNQVFALGLPCADDEETDKEGHGLSTGAKAGIGVGVGLGALLLILLSIWACFRVRRHRKRKPEVPQGIPTASPAFIDESKTGTIVSAGHISPALQATGFPAQVPQNVHPQDPGYGQGFVDGIKAALSPYQGSPHSPPPFYGSPRTYATHPPAEAPAESMRHGRSVDRAAELSASETNTRNSVV